MHGSFKKNPKRLHHRFFISPVLSPSQWEGGFGIFNVRNDFSSCCAFGGETSLAESAQGLTRKYWKSYLPCLARESNLILPLHAPVQHMSFSFCRHLRKKKRKKKEKILLHAIFCMSDLEKKNKQICCLFCPFLNKHFFWRMHVIGVTCIEHYKSFLVVNIQLLKLLTMAVKWHV